MTYAVPSTEIGLAVEVTRGTPVAPVIMAKVMSPDYTPNLTLLQDSTLQGSMVSVYDETPGMRYDSHGWKTNAYMDALPYYVLAELGSPDTKVAAPTATTLSALAAVGATTVSTAATIPVGSVIVIGTGAVLETHVTTAVSGSGPYTVTLQYPLIYAQASGATVTGLTTHQWSLLNNVAGTGNQPPSLTITDNDGEEWRQIAAAQLDKLSIDMTPNKQIDLSVNFLGNPSITPSAPSLSASTVQMAPGWTSQIAIGGTQLTYVESISLDFARGTKPIEAFTGNQGYYQYFAGPLSCSGKMTVIGTSGEPQIASYLAGTEASLDVTFFDRKSGYLCKIHSTNTIFTTAKLVRSKEYVEVELDFQLLPTSTDATAGGVSPVNVVIGNAVTTAYN